MTTKPSMPLPADTATTDPITEAELTLRQDFERRKQQHKTESLAQAAAAFEKSEADRRARFIHAWMSDNYIPLRVVWSCQPNQLLGASSRLGLLRKLIQKTPPQAPSGTRGVGGWSREAQANENLFRPTVAPTPPPRTPRSARSPARRTLRGWLRLGGCCRSYDATNRKSVATPDNFENTPPRGVRHAPV